MRERAEYETLYSQELHAHVRRVAVEMCVCACVRVYVRESSI